MKVFAWIFGMIQIANALLHVLDFAAKGSIAWMVAWMGVTAFATGALVWILRMIRREEHS